MTLGDLSIQSKRSRKKVSRRKAPNLDTLQKSTKRSRLKVVHSGVVTDRSDDAVMFVQFSVVCIEDSADVLAEVGIGFDGGTDSTLLNSFVRRVCFIPGHVSDELRHLSELDSRAGMKMNIEHGDDPDWTLAVVADDSVALDISLKIRGVKAA